VQSGFLNAASSGAGSSSNSGKGSAEKARVEQAWATLSNAARVGAAVLMTFKDPIIFAAACAAIALGGDSLAL
jgi:hypothetical protein